MDDDKLPSELEQWIAMRGWFANMQPGSPVWYHAVDHIMQRIITDRVNALTTQQRAE